MSSLLETMPRSSFASRYEWYDAVIGGSNLILRGRSALEYLGYFSGYRNYNEIEVYALENGRYANVYYKIVNNLSDIEHVNDGRVLCSTFSQAINDMLNTYPYEDEQALVEALSDYYFRNNSSFEGLNIHPANQPLFETMKNWAIEYYDEALA